MLKPRSGAQPKRDKDKYDGRLDGGPPQDDPAFCFRLHLTCPTSAMRPCPYDVAATPASHEFYSDDGSNRCVALTFNWWQR
jgi:hypothetical protein